MSNPFRLPEGITIDRMPDGKYVISGNTETGSHLLYHSVGEESHPVNVFLWNHPLYNARMSCAFGSYEEAINFVRDALKQDYSSEHQPLTFKKIREANLARDKEIFNEIGVWSLADWGIALAGEVGEALNKMKKLRKASVDHKKWKPENVSVKDVADEFADVLVYLDILAHDLGIDLDEAYRNKFNQVSEEIGSTIRL